MEQINLDFLILFVLFFPLLNIFLSSPPKLLKQTYFTTLKLIYNIQVGKASCLQKNTHLWSCGACNSSRAEQEHTDGHLLKILPSPMACKGKDNRTTELPPKYRENGLDLSEEGRSQSKLYINLICNYVM